MALPTVNGQCALFEHKTWLSLALFWQKPVKILSTAKGFTYKPFKRKCYNLYTYKDHSNKFIF